MGCAGSSVLLLLLLSLSLSAEANKERMGDNAGRKWFLRGRRPMAAPGHGYARKEEPAGAKNTGANPAHASGGVKTVEVAVVGLTGGPRSGGKFAGQVPFHSDYYTARTHPSYHN